MKEKAEKAAADLDRIHAESVVLEVTDAETGLSFRRSLPLSYTENANGILLAGEDVSGKSVQIAFLSSFAVEKMRDLSGKGPDAPRCDGHDPA